MLVREVMTRSVEVVSPDSSLREAAELMRAVDTGALPVCDGRRLVGMVTDRDIVCRGLALGLSGDSLVSEVMSARVVWVRDDAEDKDAAKLMSQEQIRRLPVIDAQRRLVGIISIGDLTDALSDARVGHTLENISEPSPLQH